jgi:hypothetical protein
MLPHLLAQGRPALTRRLQSHNSRHEEGHCLYSPVPPSPPSDGDAGLAASFLRPWRQRSGAGKGRTAKRPQRIAASRQKTEDRRKFHNGNIVVGIARNFELAPSLVDASRFWVWRSQCHGYSCRGATPGSPALPSINWSSLVSALGISGSPSAPRESPSPRGRWRSR